MTAPLTALHLLGDVVLLLWGMRTVQRGVERAFGSDLRRILGRALRNRLVALATGAAVTMLLQSSTATALMVTSFAARGIIDLVPALAVMLGANIGTALIVKALSFDVSWLSPLLLIAGFAATKRCPKGRWRELGRVGIGLGLMLLALHLLVGTMANPGLARGPGGLATTLVDDPVLRPLLHALTADPLIDVLIAALVTLVAHSSVAVVLLLAGFVATNDLLSPLAAAALVLGANLGGALPPVLESGGANRRIPVGNLILRGLACLATLPFLRPVTTLLHEFEPNPAAAVTSFHLAFNVLLAILAIGLLGPVSRLLMTLFPDKAKPRPLPPAPLFLQEEHRQTPYLALSNAAREILRMGDLVLALLDLVAPLPPAKLPPDQARRLGRELHALHAAVKAYLARLDRAELTERDAIRLSDLLEFAINLGHAGDLLERRATRPAPAPATHPADLAAARAIHATVRADLELALSTMITEDERSARELLAAKRALNDQERAAARGHLARLAGADPATAAGSRAFLSTLLDLKLVNSHIASIAYAVLSPTERPHAQPPAIPVKFTG